MMEKKKSKLANLSKPGPSKKFELESEESDQIDMDRASELAGESIGDDAPIESPNPELGSISDEDLLAELRRRGLDSKAEKLSEEPSGDDEYLA